MSSQKPTNIQIYRKKWNFNIGIFIFGVIFIYLTATILLYLTGNHVSIYEVREGSIQRDDAYTGLVIRDETVVQADAEGYVNYFILEGSKVGAQTSVYCLSPDKLTFADPSASDASQSLTAEEQASILQQTKNFSDSFQSDNFSDVYTLKDTISTVLDSKSNQSRRAQLNQMAAEDPSSLRIYPAASDGIAVFSVDGYESVKAEDVTEDMIAKTDYKVTGLPDNMYVRAGDPVYKLIRSDVWQIAILLDKETAKELQDVSRISIQFSKDEQTTTAGLDIRKKGKTFIGFLTIEASMIRYAADRYVDVELILEDQSGLKIPKSSVVEKEFYIVPEDYLTLGGNSKETGVLVDDGTDNARFQEAEVYYRDNETGMVYLDTDLLEEGVTLRKEDSDHTCQLKEKASLQGVYNINKGYAEFRQVKILCASDEYYIIESGNDYGLANYDHIALDGDGIHENDVIF